MGGGLPRAFAAVCAEFEDAKRIRGGQMWTLLVCKRGKAGAESCSCKILPRQAELLTPDTVLKNVYTYRKYHTHTQSEGRHGVSVFSPKRSLYPLPSLCLTFDRSWQRKGSFLLCQHSKDFLKSSFGLAASPRNNKIPVIWVVFPSECVCIHVGCSLISTLRRLQHW